MLSFVILLETSVSVKERQKNTSEQIQDKDRRPNFYTFYTRRGGPVCRGPCVGPWCQAKRVSMLKPGFLVSRNQS